MNTQLRDWHGIDEPLPLGHAGCLAERTFRMADVPAIRRVAAEFAAGAGIAASRLPDFVLAVNEAAGCAVAHGPCTARLRLWSTGRRAFCEIRGDGMLQGPRAALQGDAEALRRWMLKRICDHVSIRSGPDGVVVLLSMALAA